VKFHFYILGFVNIRMISGNFFQNIYDVFKAFAMLIALIEDLIISKAVKRIILH
jgi:hypothetical protein